ncbi:MAG TPA: transketolase C-terminal domain-containing protein, partial [Thermodesulfobacteriota bacterium]|nr:transketolase C-terminal domain-containing protein [Thermodesulfobacteriota bacterium]
KVVMPATPYDAKGLLVSSIYDDNPVIMIEHRWLYEHVGHLPSEVYTVPLGKGIVRRSGGDVTIVAVSYMVYEAVKAAEELSEEGIECEVVDLRTLKPMDAEIVLDSVKKTGRLVVADTGWRECGFSAEVLSKVFEDAETFNELKAPAVRVALPDVPTPASPVLEEAFYPGSIDIVEAVKKVFTHSKGECIKEASGKYRTCDHAT